LARAVEGTRKGLAILEDILLSTTRRRAEYGSRFPFFAEQVVEEILKLRKAIDDRIGLTAYLAEFGLPSPADAEPAVPTTPTTPPATLTTVAPSA
jgi:hypothetical protein